MKLFVLSLTTPMVWYGFVLTLRGRFKRESRSSCHNQSQIIFNIPIWNHLNTKHVHLIALLHRCSDNQKGAWHNGRPFPSPIIHKLVWPLPLVECEQDPDVRSRLQNIYLNLKLIFGNENDSKHITSLTLRSKTYKTSKSLSLNNFASNKKLTPICL
jgi:hypothetical protein